MGLRDHPHPCLPGPLPFPGGPGGASGSRQDPAVSESCFLPCPFFPGPPSGPVIRGGKAPGAPRTCGPEGELSGEMWPASWPCADPNLGRIQNNKNLCPVSLVMTFYYFHF